MSSDEIEPSLGTWSHPSMGYFIALFSNENVFHVSNHIDVMLPVSNIITKHGLVMIKLHAVIASTWGEHQRVQITR